MAVKTRNNHYEATTASAPVSTWKVLGEIDSAGAAGVLGYNLATAGSGYGVTNSTAGRAAGVKAEATTGSANGILASSEGGMGIEATTSDPQSYAVWGRHIGSSGTSSDYAILGQTFTQVDGVAGVKGMDGFGGTSETYGVRAVTNSGNSDAAAVEAVAPGGATAVRAKATSGVGLSVTGGDVGTRSNPFAHAAFIETNDTDLDNQILALKTGNTSEPGPNNHFVGFFDGNDNLLGAIEGDGNGGVTNASAGSDYAEFMPRLNPDEQIAPADVVGVVDGAVTRRTDGVDQAMVVTDRAIVLGNTPGHSSEDRADHEKVAFVGQVPVKVRGTTESGDLIAPSGEGDGTGRAITADEWTPGDGPIVGRAWEETDETGVDEVTVAVGLETGKVVEPAVADRADRIDDLRGENARIRAELDRKDARIADLESQVADLRARNEALEARLAGLDDRVAQLESGGTAPASADD